MCKNEQPIGIRDARGRKCKVPFAIMRHSNGGFDVVLNNYPIKGSFPNSAAKASRTRPLTATRLPRVSKWECITP